MNPRVLLHYAVAVGVCLGVLGTTVSAQTMLAPHKILILQREVVKPGKGHAHGLVEAQWAQAFKDAKASGWMGMTSLSGETRALFVQGFDSEAAWAANTASVAKNAALSAKSAALADKDGDFLTGAQQAVLKYLPELSYHADSIPVAGLRYWRIGAIHLKPGYGDDFIERRKIVKAAHEKAKLDEAFLMYHVLEGSNGFDTYVIFIPMKSLAEDDDNDALHGEAYRKALPEDWKATGIKFAREAVSSGDTQLFAVDPSMTVAPKEWIEADKFWDPKPMMAKPMAKAKTDAKDAPKQ